MAATNPDSIINVQDGFHARAPIEKPIGAQNPGPRDQPLERHAHHPGVLVGKERIPEFHAETLPAGTAPKKDTYAPNTLLSDNAVTEESTATSAAETLGGATSGDVHKPLEHAGLGGEGREDGRA